MMTGLPTWGFDFSRLSPKQMAELDAEMQRRQENPPFPNARHDFDLDRKMVASTILRHGSMKAAREFHRRMVEMVEKRRATRAQNKLLQEQQKREPGYVYIYRFYVGSDAYYKITLEPLNNRRLEPFRIIWTNEGAGKLYDELQKRFKRFRRGLSYALSLKQSLWVISLKSDVPPQGRTEVAPAIATPKKARKLRTTAGYVYLLKSDKGYYKIGRTANPDDRLRTFNVKLPFDVQFEHVIQTGDMYALEAELHAKFARVHVNGEWFALTADDVAYIKTLGGDDDE